MIPCLHCWVAWVQLQERSETAVRFVYLDFLRIGSCVEAAHPMCGSSHQPPCPTVALLDLL